MYHDYCRPKYRISPYISYINENLKICYSHAINLKFGQDHTIDKRNVSCKFYQYPTRGRYFLKICLQMRTEFVSKYWQIFKKYLPHAGFGWNLQETFLLSIVWSVQISSRLHDSSRFHNFHLYRKYIGKFYIFDSYIQCTSPEFGENFVFFCPFWCHSILFQWKQWWRACFENMTITPPIPLVTD